MENIKEERKPIIKQFIESDFSDIGLFLSIQQINISLSEEDIIQINSEKKIIDEIKNRTIVGNQHYVPRFYIKKFYNLNNKIEVFDILNKRIGKPKAAKEICFGLHFYSRHNCSNTKTGQLIGQLVEEILKHYEDIISPIYDKLLDNIERGNLSEQNRFKLAEFIIVSYIRSKGFKKQFGIDEEKNNDLQLRFINPDNIGLWANEIIHKSWIFYITNHDYCFVTSDNPVIDVVEPQYINIPFGQSLIMRTQYITLSPKVLLKIEYNDNETFNFHTEKINDEMILYLNKRRLIHSEFIYSCNKNELKDLI